MDWVEDDAHGRRGDEDVGGGELQGRKTEKAGELRHRTREIREWTHDETEDAEEACADVGGGHEDYGSGGAKCKRRRGGRSALDFGLRR